MSYGRRVTAPARRLVPIVTWLPRYRRTWLPSDLIAGATIWGLLVPEMIAYASLAGLPAQAGLYTVLASLALYAIFGTSRHLVVAGTSASAVLIFSAITEIVPTTSKDYPALAAALILLTGFFFVVGGLLKLGFITEFLSRPVVSGFVFGLAIFVTVSQLPKLLGIQKSGGNTFEQLWHVLGELPDTSVVTLAVGAAALLVLFGLERYVPRVPGGLVVLVAGIVASSTLNLVGHGVAIIGDIPAGLPALKVPDVSLSDLGVLIPSALGMLLVIYSEALGAATTFADKHGYRIDPDQDMLALGLANLASGLLGGLAAGGSLSQTAVNEGAGAKTELSPIVAAALSLVTVVALTSLFHDLPEAVLAALIIHAVFHLMRAGEMRRYYQLSPLEFWLGMLTLVGVLVLDVLPGLLIGVIVSIILVVGRAARPHASLLGRDSHRSATYEDLDRHDGVEPVPNFVLVRPNVPVFYVNAQAIRDAIEQAVAAQPRTRAVVIDLGANDTLDITAADMLGKLASDLTGRGVQLRLARVHAPVLDMASRAGLLEHIPREHIFQRLSDAVDSP